MMNAEPYFHHGTALLRDGWTMRRIDLDASGYDRHGWGWGPGNPVFVVSPPGVDDTLSVRAPCPALALWVIESEGWPPTKVKRFNWSYETL